MGVGQYRKCISKAFAIPLESVVWHMWQNVWLKLFFWRIGFHMCADRPRKHWRKSSRRRGFWRYCDCYCETAHWLVWTDSMKEREREWFWREGKAGVEGRSLSENSRSLLPLLRRLSDIRHFLTFWTLTQVWFISYSSSLLLSFAAVLPQLFGKSKLNWCWCYMWVAQ